MSFRDSINRSSSRGVLLSQKIAGGLAEKDTKDPNGSLVGFFFHFSNFNKQAWICVRRDERDRSTHLSRVARFI